MSERLIAQLGAESATLATRVIGAMYRDPFWAERFGERGEKHALEDARYHVSYLMQAIGMGDEALFERYARWLQGVLVSRRMCSRHLHDSFEKLGDEIARALPESEPALSLLVAGQRALRYEGAPAALLQDEALARAASKGEETLPTDTAGTAYHLSYLADAIHAGRPEWFVEHIAWLSGLVVRLGAPHDALPRQLDELRLRLTRSEWLTLDLARTADALLGAALQRITPVPGREAP